MQLYQKQIRLSLSLSLSLPFFPHRVTVAQVFFCSLKKGLIPKIRILPFVLINSVFILFFFCFVFEPFMCLDLFSCLAKKRLMELNYIALVLAIVSIVFWDKFQC